LQKSGKEARAGVIDRPEKEPFIVSDYLRLRFKGIIEAIAGFLNRLGFMPNHITTLGLLGNIAAAILLAYGYFLPAGILAALMGALDGIDGTMVRLRKLPSEYGAFADSVSDRYSELIILGGLLVHFMRQDDWINGLGVYLAAAGSVLVSYIRARAGAVGMDTKVGILSRFERYLVLVPSLLFSIPHIGVWIIAVLANITALQRIIDVRRQARAKNLIFTSRGNHGNHSNRDSNR
jgi:CDP-diacylglycerol--glycerol-3-phosphate 3-phosphatidyltransferase